MKTGQVSEEQQQLENDEIFAEKNFFEVYPKSCEKPFFSGDTY